MTEKRFKLHIVWVNYDKTDGSATLSDNGQPLLECECVEDMRRVKELLNELNDKNEQLKKELDKLNILYKAKCKTEEQLLEMGKEVEKENEQLKSKYKVLHMQHQDLQKFVENNFDEHLTQQKLNRQIIKLSGENEQLKSTIKEVTELLSEEVDLFSDKATEHDINAYVELIELDNKDSYYMATATKKAIRMLKELQRND